MVTLLVLVGLLAPPPAEVSSYEDQRLHRALGIERLEVEPAPEGRKIAFVRVVREDVFAEDEWIPTFFNYFHWLTDEDVVAREVRLNPGEPYSSDRAEETARILRDLAIFSLVRVVPVRVEEPGAVGVVVYTRDLWSLRLEQRFQLTGGTLDEGVLQLTERNLFGRDKNVTLRFAIAPLSYSLGDIYLDPRLLGSELALAQSFDLIFGREANDLEGARGSLTVERPLRDLAARYGYSVGGQFDVRVARQIQGGQVLTYDDPDTTDVETIARTWDQAFVSAQASGTRQLGAEFKHQVRVGGGFSWLRAEIREEEAPPEENEDAFERDVLPSSRQSIFPFASYAGFEPRWRTFENLATFGLDEDVRVGPSWGGSVAVPLAALGSTRDAVEVGARLAYVAAWAGDGLAEAAVAGQTRFEGRERLDEVLYLRGRGATPSLGVGRLVLVGDYIARRDDSGRALVSLGGDNGLRGYESQAFYGFGVDRARLNLEYRTPPLALSFLHLGAVLFYDGGSVHERLTALDWKESAGIGIRGLIPQFSRITYRADVGFPLRDGGFTVLLSAGSGQAVPLTRGEDEDEGATVGGLAYVP